jgi:hypothetical protein
LKASIADGGEKLLNNLAPETAKEESFLRDRPAVFKSNADSPLEFNAEVMKRERVVAKATRLIMLII